MGSTLGDPLLHSKDQGNEWRTKGSKREDLDEQIPLYQEYGKHSEDGELPPELYSANQGTSSFWAATSNTFGLLLGMGMLSVPYAVQQGGLFSLSILLFFASTMCYTGYLLGKCLATSPAIVTFQDIGAAAFGLKGRVLLTICLYLEVYACLVGYTISVGDNLAQIFPDAGFSLSWIHLKPSQFLVSLSMLLVLPSVCVRDLSYVSYLSFGGMAASLTVVGAVAWAGLFGGVGFSQSVPLFQIMKVPLVSGLYAFCYSGHVIIPSIYTSMKDPRKFLKVLILSFGLATGVFGGLALMGAFMFGDKTLAQITLNLPTYLLAAQIALWTTVINPLCKFSLGIAPVAKELESLLPFPENSLTHFTCGSLIRISFLVSILALALALPFFGYVLALIGSAISISMSIIFPCSLYLKIFWSSASKFEVYLLALLILIGFIFTVIGTESSLKGLIESL